MTELSFVIPYKFDLYRQKILKFTIERLESHFPDAEILIANGYSGDQAFNRSRSINTGAEAATGEFLAVVDGDTVFNSWVLHRALGIMQDESVPWMIPYTEYYRTNERTGRAILDFCPPGAMIWRAGSVRGTGLEHDREAVPMEYDHVITHPPVESYQSPQSGLLLFRREQFMDIGGFNEKFVGWGYEDRGMVYAADTLIGLHRRMDAPVFHIWHPESHETTEGQPHIDENRRLAEEMRQAIGNPERMRELNNG